MQFLKFLLLAMATIVFVYILSRIQATAWLHSFEKFLSNKSNSINFKIEENEQQKQKDGL